MQSFLYTPTQDKYASPKWSQHRDPSLYFSNIQKSGYKSTQPGSQSPYRSTTISRLEEAKRNIDLVIGDIEQKRDLNDQAYSQIRSVNSDVLDSFRRNHSVYQKNNISPFVPEMKSSYVATGTSEQIDLRTQLNQEIRRNNDLLMRLSRLQEENKLLRREKQMSFGPNQEMIQLQSQNDRLRKALSRSSQLPEQVFSDLQELKRQNQMLRQDTTKLLRKVQGFS